jgi:hypothetical protein
MAGDQRLGKIVESSIQTQLKTRLLPLGIRVKTQFRGYDLGAYVDDPLSADVRFNRGAVEDVVGED